MKYVKKLISWILCICLALPIAVGTPFQTKAAENGKIRITCVGDSITDGYMASGGNKAYPQQMQQVLGEQYEVLNKGVSGSTVMRSYNEAYSKTGKYTEGLASKPDIVIIMIGTNDAVKGGIDGKEKQEEFKRDYEQLIKDYQNCGTNPKIILALPPTSVDDGGDGHKKDSRCKNNENYIIPIIKDVAKEYGLQLLDTHNYTGSWTREAYENPYLADGLHPNDAGYEKLAKFFANAVLGYNNGYPGDVQENTNYTISSKLNQKALTIDGFLNDNNAGLVQMTNHNYASQNWTFESTGDGYYRIVNTSSKKVLDVPDSSTKEGTQIIQFNKGNGDNQKWKLEAVGDGYWRITPKVAQKMGLNVSGNSNEDGGIIVQWPYASAKNEQWILGHSNSVAPNPELETADARAAFDAYVEKFVVDKGDYCEVTNISGFWAEAEIREMFIDAYERFGDDTAKDLMVKTVEGWIKKHGTDWKGNEYNDDIMWAVIMCVRTYLNTGNQRYLDLAKANFDVCYNRAWTDTLGGGLVWKQGNTSKNACVNGPGAIAACLLAEAAKDNSYYDKAKGIVAWMNDKLVQQDGSVWDSINWENNEISNWVSTYNQGTYIGACTLLYVHSGDRQYFDMAKRAADRAVKLGTILNGEQNNADLIGFKGILARWMGRFALDLEVADYNGWMQNNADTAWSNRNNDNLMWTQFGVKAIENLENSQETVEGGSIEDGKHTIGGYASWGCSAPLSWLINCGDMAERQKDGIERFPIEIEVAQMAGGAGLVKVADCSNGYRIGNIGGNANGTVTFTVTAETAGGRDLYIYYATWDARDLNVIVNGQSDVVTCPGIGSWDKPGDTPAILKVTLRKGENTITLAGAEGKDAPNIDRIELGMTEEETKNLVTALIDSIPDNITGSDADKARINGVKQAFDDLSDEAKAGIKNLGRLNEALHKLAVLEGREEEVVCLHPNTERRGAQDATCGSEGYTGDVYCTECNTLLTEGEVMPVETDNHRWNDGVVTTPPSAGKDGVITFTCTVCGDTYKGTIKCEHKQTKRQNARGATCAERGYTGDVCCLQCDEIIDKGKEIPATGSHKWNDGAVTTPATAEKSGEITFICMVCDEIYTVTYEAGGLEKRKDKEAADKVKEAISAIGTVTLGSEQVIQAARKAFNALSEEQKELVDNYDALAAAEKKLKQLKDEARAKEEQEKKLEQLKSEAGHPDDQAVKAESITITGISKKIAAGRKVTLKAVVTPENASDSTVTWSSSNEKYATVDGNGKVSVKKAGKNKKVTIYATANDGSNKTAGYTITIMSKAVKKVKIQTKSKSVKAGKKLTLKAVVTPNLSTKKVNKTVRWSSSNEAYATVTKKGIVKTKKSAKGKNVTITAMATDGSGKKGKIKISIK